MRRNATYTTFLFVSSQKGIDEARRQSEALAAYGARGRWEVPDASQLSRAAKVFKKAGGINNIDVTVVNE